jgi:YppG-like protein
MPIRPRRSMHPFFPSGPLRRPSRKQNFMSYFRTPEGNLDFNKITGTVQQAKQMYDQVRPLITKYLKK